MTGQAGVDDIVVAVDLICGLGGNKRFHSTDVDIGEYIVTGHLCFVVRGFGRIDLIEFFRIRAFVFAVQYCRTSIGQLLLHFAHKQRELAGAIRIIVLLNGKSAGQRDDRCQKYECNGSIIHKVEHLTPQRSVLFQGQQFFRFQL